MIRIAMLSFWHVHGKDYARETDEHPDTEIAAIWDEVPERGRAEAAARGVPFFESLDELLAQPNIDAVVVDAPTSLHREVMIAAARAGKHIFTEKVIASTLRDAEEIVREADRAGVRFVVSLRRLPFASTRAIKNIVDQGLLGDLTLVSVRDGHSAVLPSAANPRGFLSDEFLDPALAQGGVLIDMCHSVYLTRHLLGAPESVSASFGFVSGRPVEDNAVLTMRCANGALGIAHATYVVRAAPFAIEVHGTEGSLLISGFGDDAALLRMGADEPETLFPPVNYLEETRGHSGLVGAFGIFLEQLANAITDHLIAPELPTFADGVQITRLIDAIRLAAREKRRVAVSEI